VGQAQKQMTPKHQTGLFVALKHVLKMFNGFWYTNK